MKIERTQIFALVLILSAGMTATAQETGAVTSSTAALQQTRALLNAGREEIIKDEIRMSDAESTAFWPVYERYQAALQPVRDRYAGLLTGYLNSYRAGTVSEEMANRIIDEYLQIQIDVLDIKKDFLDDFRAALPARMAARFYQLENKMELELESQLSLIVPLIDPV